MNTGDIAWVLVSSCLVMLMTPAVGLFYGGMVQQKNLLSTIMLSFVTLLVVTLQWVMFGYSLAFGPDYQHFIGAISFGLASVSASVPSEYASTIPQLAFMLFQMKFAIITPALITGAFAERVKFPAFIIFTLLWATMVYDPVAHWVWGNGGWLHSLGSIDFAGGTVVHITAGVAALAVSAALGRKKPLVDTRFTPISVSLTLFGAVLLWFGWFGFNGGSALAANGVAVQALVTTNVAAAAAALTWLVLSMYKGKPSAVGTATGAVVGLVAITPACGFVDIPAAFIIGAMGSVVSFACILLAEKFGIDDPLDVCACHGMAGTWGSIATGIFATKLVNPGGADGALHGNINLLYAQLAATASVWLFTFVVTYAIAKLVDLSIGFTVSRDVQDIGLDAAHYWDDIKESSAAQGISLIKAEVS